MVGWDTRGDSGLEYLPNVGFPLPITVLLTNGWFNVFVVEGTLGLYLPNVFYDEIGILTCGTTFGLLVTGLFPWVVLILPLFGFKATGLFP